MSRTDHSRGCPSGRDCGVCHPGKQRPPARVQRELQSFNVEEECEPLEFLDWMYYDEPDLGAPEWEDWFAIGPQFSSDKPLTKKLVER